MKLCSSFVSGIALAAGTDFFDFSAEDALQDGDALQLLQLRASSVSSPVHKVYSNASSNQPKTYSGHAFGCTGRTTAVEVVSCALGGDVHDYKEYNGAHGPNSDGTGWYWIAKSKDGSFQAQAFYYEKIAWGISTLSNFALKFGDSTVFLDRVNVGGRWIWKYYWDGEEKSYSDTPLEEGDLYWVNKAAGQIVATGAQEGLGYVNDKINGDNERLSCFEYKQVSVWTSFQNWQPAGEGPWAQPAMIDLEGAIDFLDPAFGTCATNHHKVATSDIFVTKAQNDKICRDNKLSEHDCVDPDPPPPPPTKEQLCERNGVEMSHAEDLCADQKTHAGDIYQDCLFDVCASADAEAQLNAVGGSELEAALMNPEAKCTVKSDSCLPCEICFASTSVDLSSVVQNNLGGLGPDAGAEEIRYKNAIDVDGKKIDVVLTAEGDAGEYKTPKPQKNGYTGTGFGRFTMKTKSSSNFKFSFVDATTGEPVGVKDLALTFYDLDQAKNTRQQETVSVCGAEEVYTTSDTELVHKQAGNCHGYTSTTRGTGKDNPAKPDDLTKTQAARSVTYEFHSRASITFSASVSGSGKNPRPILFSFEPQVACGASDAETHCTQ